MVTPQPKIHQITLKKAVQERGRRRNQSQGKGISQYDYQLRGCVIHAGVAGAGHYWSSVAHGVITIKV